MRGRGGGRRDDKRAALAVIYVYAAAASALTVETRRWLGLVASGRLIGSRTCARTHERAHCVLQHPSEATGYRRRCATLSPCAFLPSTDSGGCNPSSLRFYCPWALSDRSSLSSRCTLSVSSPGLLPVPRLPLFRTQCWSFSSSWFGSSWTFWFPSWSSWYFCPVSCLASLLVTPSLLWSFTIFLGPSCPLHFSPSSRSFYWCHVSGYWFDCSFFTLTIFSVSPIHTVFLWFFISLNFNFLSACFCRSWRI